MIFSNEKWLKQTRDPPSAGRLGSAPLAFFTGSGCQHEGGLIAPLPRLRWSTYSLVWLRVVWCGALPLVDLRRSPLRQLGCHHGSLPVTWPVPFRGTGLFVVRACDTQVRVIEILQSRQAVLHCAATKLRGGGHGGRSASE